jgi:hypothetical protein
MHRMNINISSMSNDKEEYAIPQIYELSGSVATFLIFCCSAQINDDYDDSFEEKITQRSKIFFLVADSTQVSIADSLVPPSYVIKRSQNLMTRSKKLILKHFFVRMRGLNPECMLYNASDF